MLSENNFKKVFVTGASGLVGSHVASLLLEKGYQVYMQYFSNKPLVNHQNSFLLKMDLSKPISLAKLQGIDAVIHCAAEIPSSFNDDQIARVAERNTVIDQQIIRFCKESAAKLVYFSSCSVYGSAPMPWTEDRTPLPANLYSKGKLHAEKQIITELKDYLIYRISSPYGPGQKNKNVLLKFIESKTTGKDIYLYNNGTRKQDFIFVNDIANAVLKGIIQKNARGVLNIAHGQTISMLSLAEAILSIQPLTTSQIVYFNEVDNQKDYNPNIIIHKAKKILNWIPLISIHEGLKQMSLQHV